MNLSIDELEAIKKKSFEDGYEVGHMTGFEEGYAQGMDYSDSCLEARIEELEEERRLMYVAITRAQIKLYITRAKSRYIYGNRSITSESRFLKEIRPMLLDGSQNSNCYNNTYNNGYNFNRQKTQENYGYYSDESYPSRVIGKTKSFSSNYNFGGVVKPKTNQNNSSKYKPNMKVKHAKFGSGVVIAVKNDGKVIDVAFKGVGVKSLASEIAPLEIE